ncbi:Thiamine pyridinylase [Gloeothece citriformis PCC 7424]|uniref:Thiamine pyridinylase n=1 Tax=Gloeothece citriformis (strain PCC 7424) TaxID=65393 RepID=B7KC44_GLOC7|nr:thiamine pyridinylase [Gloeothece citriformis]ACK68867.1 Thiamine pyridinylase [Gloeothece citriformis PCC 7424]
MGKRRKFSLGLLLFVFIGLLLFVPASWATTDQSKTLASTKPRENQEIIKVGLFPYVPRIEQFKDVITQSWSEIEPNVKLEFVDEEQWDGGYKRDPDGIDVFVFDGIFLEYFVKNNYLASLKSNEIDKDKDFLSYALEGSQFNDIYYGIPQLGCTNLLFYRQNDAAKEKLANATTLTSVYEVIGNNPSSEVPPPSGEGLLIDLSGGTTCACYYVDIAMDLTGQYTTNPDLPDPEHLSSEAIETLRQLVSMAGPTQAQYEGDSYERETWFGKNHGRANVGFTEGMSAMGQTRQDIEFKVMPLGNEHNINLFYVDLIGLNHDLESNPKRKSLALKLANLMSSREVMVKSIKAYKGEPPQYLMPVRLTVFNTLKETDPLYDKMYQLVSSSDPKAFRLGENSREWLQKAKRKIQQQIYEQAKLLEEGKI